MERVRCTITGAHKEDLFIVAAGGELFRKHDNCKNGKLAANVCGLGCIHI